MTTTILFRSLSVSLLLLAITYGTISTAFAAFSPPVSATIFTPKTKDAIATKRALLDERHREIKLEALASVTGAQNALLLLKNNESKRATALLKETAKQLDVLLTKYPQSNLIPAISDADIYEFEGDSKQLESQINTANELLADHRVQAARVLLDQLVSEIHVTTISVPIGSFSMGVKDAAYLVNSGNDKKAIDVLYEVMNRLVKTVEISPIPLLQAVDQLDAAKKLESTSDTANEASKTQILMLLDAAKEKLKLSENLGYGAKNDYIGVYEAIDVLKNKLFTQESADAWNNLSSTFSGLKDKLVRVKK